MTPKTLDDIDTPAVIIDLDRVEANIARAQACADKFGLKMRPHIKTHKLPVFALKQLAAGAVGITCQKIGEAEVMADAGISDIFLPYNIIGPAKLARLLALHRRVVLSVTTDNATVLAGLAATFTDPARPLTVLVECETGMERCGVQTPADTLPLARAIDAAPGLRFGGLMTYPARGKFAATDRWLTEARELLAAAGLPCERISSGGTPDMRMIGDTRVATEFRQGTYIYLDRFQVDAGAGALEDCALTVLATVISRPTDDRAVIDAGSKGLTSDLSGYPDHGLVLGHPRARVAGLSEEHGNIALNGEDLQVGQRVQILPNHACVVTNMYDVVHLVSGGRVVEVLPVAARGRMG